MKDILLLILAIVAIVSCVLQYFLLNLLWGNITKLPTLIENKFETLYAKQQRIFSKKYWSSAIKSEPYFDKEVLNHIRYDLTPAEVKVMCESYLTGKYDPEVADALGNYVYIMSNHYYLYHTQEDRREYFRKQTQKILLRMTCVDNVAVCSLFKDGRIYSCFDNPEDTVPNQYVYDSTNDCITKEEFVKIYDFFMTVPSSRDAFSRIKKNYVALYEFIVHSRFFKNKEKYGLDNLTPKVVRENMMNVLVNLYNPDDTEIFFDLLDKVFETYSLKDSSFEYILFKTDGEGHIKNNYRLKEDFAELLYSSYYGRTEFCCNKNRLYDYNVVAECKGTVVSKSIFDDEFYYL